MLFLSVLDKRRKWKEAEPGKPSEVKSIANGYVILFQAERGEGLDERTEVRLGLVSNAGDLVWEKTVNESSKFNDKDVFGIVVTNKYILIRHSRDEAGEYIATTTGKKAADPRPGGDREL